MYFIILPYFWNSKIKTDTRSFIKPAKSNFQYICNKWFPEHWPQGILTPEHWPQELWPKGISIPRNLAQRNFAPNGKLTQRNFAHRNFDLRNIHPNGNFTQRNFDQWSTEVPSEVWSTVCILIIFWNYLYPVLQSSYEENCSTKISYQFVECSIASFERFAQSK